MPSIHQRAPDSWRGGKGGKLVVAWKTFLKMYGFQVGPVILGIILGPLIDVSYRRAMIFAGDEPPQFLLEFFTSPVSIVLVAALALTVLSQTALWKKLTGRTLPKTPD